MSRDAGERIDVLIGGGGIAGLALAVALRQGLGDGFSVTVADPALARAPADPRASAIVAAARRLLAAIGVWDAIAADAQPVLDMVVTDSRLADVVRPVFLTFDGDLEPDEPFAHMVENGPLLAALLARARQLGVTLLADSVADLNSGPPPARGRSRRASAAVFDAKNADAEHRLREASRVGVTSTMTAQDPSPERLRRLDPPLAGEGAGARIAVRLSDGRELTARLLVAADGARSRIRDRAGIALRGWAYGQSAIVTTVGPSATITAAPRSIFSRPGPFAILPLKGRRSSIVWTESEAEAARILALPDAGFHDELERRFGLALGDIADLGPRGAYPIGLWVARAFVADRIALIGDAAHVIHPIAGQGLNLGLKDVAALAETVVDAARLGLDPGTAAVLERYQRWRRFDTTAMAAATDALNRLFSNRSDVLRLARDLGLGLVDRLPALKQLFIREAAGLVGDVPRLLRGEAL